MTETEKMLAGKIYDPTNEFLESARAKAHRLCKLYNDTFENETEKRAEIINELIPRHGKDICLLNPIIFDYGIFTEIGDRFFANFNLTVLDCCPVKIGNDVMFGPNVTIATPVHPFRWQDRNMRVRENGQLYDLEYAKPITIGDNCWLASNVIVAGGVTIGEGCVIGAGSVVTRDIPPNSFAAGNPCRVIREITDKDDIALKEFLW